MMIRLTVLTLSLLAIATASLAANVTPQQLWQQATDGDVRAQFRLGQHHLDPNTPDYDPDAASYWLLQAANNGSAEAATEYALLLLSDTEDAAKMDVALRNLQLGADAGLPKAQYHLATIVAKGLLGLTPDMGRASSLMHRAAAQNYPPAQTALGVFYAQGLAGEQSDTRAEELFRKAADAGDALGQYHVAVLYLSDFYGRRDETAARVWLDRAAAQGLPQARTVLGQLDLNRAQTAPERAAALDQIRGAASAGFAEAQLIMGRLLSGGVLGAADHEAAVKWYWLAAEQGHADAQYRLGEHLLYGKGAPQDGEGGLQWLELAANQGHPQALERISRLLEAAGKQ